MKSDIEIAQETKELPINEIAAKVNLKEDDLEPYGMIRLRSIGKLLIAFPKTKN